MTGSFDIISPIDGQILLSKNYLSVAEALTKLKRAEAAQKVSAENSVLDRALLCRRFLDAFEKDLEKNARAITRAMGKPLSQAKAEVAGMRARTEALALAAPLALADQRLPHKPGVERMIRRQPLGVVLDIAAWNYPLVVAINVIAPAVLAGNAVLIKHAPQTAEVGRMFEEAFLAAGAPEGLVQDFMVDHPTVQEVLETGRIAHVGFTGSVAGGKQVYARVAAAGLTSCGLELGGKDAALVLSDADIEHVAKELVEGVFYNAGQSCCAVERIYVPEDRLKDFTEAFLAETYRLKMGDPLGSGVSLGPVVNGAAARRILQQTDEAVHRGAKEVTERGRFEVPDRSDCYLPPRVLVNVNHEMRLMKEETFGPSIGIMGYKSEQEAVALANDSPYGLTASVWTKDEERAHEVLDQLNVGTVYLNRCDAVDPELPWVGSKESGLGFTLSHLGIQALTRPKSYNLRIFREEALE